MQSPLQRGCDCSKGTEITLRHSSRARTGPTGTLTLSSPTPAWEPHWRGRHLQARVPLLRLIADGIINVDNRLQQESGTVTKAKPLGPNRSVCCVFTHILPAHPLGLFTHAVG